MLPMNILTAIEEALDAVERDIHERVSKGEGHKDLDYLKAELVEMKSETRQEASRETSRMIVDSMDWEQPCLKKFNEVRTLLRKHYRLRP